MNIRKRCMRHMYYSYEIELIPYGSHFCFKPYLLRQNKHSLTIKVQNYEKTYKKGQENTLILYVVQTEVFTKFRHVMTTHRRVNYTLPPASACAGKCPPCYYGGENICSPAPPEKYLIYFRPCVRSIGHRRLNVCCES
jgi:hypothetical protein